MGSKIGVVAALAALTLLTACGGEQKEPGGISAEESAALNNAAEMLDASPDSLTAPEDMPLDDEANALSAEGNGV